MRTEPRSSLIGRRSWICRTSDRLCKSAAAEYGHGGMKYGGGGEHGGPRTVRALRCCFSLGGGCKKKSGCTSCGTFSADNLGGKFCICVSIVCADKCVEVELVVML